MITKEEYQKTLIRMWDSVRSDDAYKGRADCYSVKCKNCPLNPVCDQGYYFTNVFDAIELVEKWGKEHPIKTNRDVFIEAIQEKFGDRINIDALNNTGCELVNRECNGDCKTCKQKNFWDKEYQEVNNG